VNIEEKKTMSRNEILKNKGKILKREKIENKFRY